VGGKNAGLRMVVGAVAGSAGALAAVGRGCAGGVLRQPVPTRQLSSAAAKARVSTRSAIFGIKRTCQVPDTLPLLTSRLHLSHMPPSLVRSQPVSAMLLKVEQIPETGTVNVSEPLVQTFIDEFLPKLQELHARGPGTVKLQFSKQGENILVHGSAGCTVEGECAACLEPMSIELQPKIGLILFKKVPGTDDAEALDEEVGASDDEEEDTTPDEGAGEYDGKVVDWGSIVREQLLLSLPMAPRCKDDCKGLCPSCGIDRNYATCDCQTDRIDPRWEKLRLVKLSKSGD
jgi:uncharacterized protein